MKSLIINMLLIAGLNLPVYLELYKHFLINRSAWIKATVTLVFWSIALLTQTVAAFTAILILYFGIYIYTSRDDNDEGIDIWHIKGKDALIAGLIAFFVRVGILLAQYIFIIILVKLVKYNIKPQDILTYYTEAQLGMKLLLAVEIVLIGPIVEEFVFRYYLYGKVLTPRMPYIAAAVFSALLFTILHFNVSGIPTFFILGLVCAYLYQKKGYWAAVIAHSIANLISLLL